MFSYFPITFSSLSSLLLILELSSVLLSTWLTLRVTPAHCGGSSTCLSSLLLSSLVLFRPPVLAPHADIVQITPLLPGARLSRSTTTATVWRGRKTRRPCCCGRTSQITTCRAPSLWQPAPTAAPATASARRPIRWVPWWTLRKEVCVNHCTRLMHDGWDLCLCSPLGLPGWKSWQPHWRNRVTI